MRDYRIQITPAQAIETLETFAYQYPNNPYAPYILDVAEMIREMTRVRPETSHLVQKVIGQIDELTNRLGAK